MLETPPPSWLAVEAEPDPLASLIEDWAEPARGIVMLGLGAPDHVVRAARAVGPRGWLLGHDDDPKRLGRAQAALNAAGCGWAQLVGGQGWVGPPEALVGRLLRLAGAAPALIVFETPSSGSLAEWLRLAEPENAPVLLGRMPDLGDGAAGGAVAAAAMRLGYLALDPIAAEPVALETSGSRDLVWGARAAGAARARPARPAAVSRASAPRRLRA
ncbi:hypothetical protein LRS10_22710 [Phenylobacterium sp. J426]|uniref:hypothetical protein n=1 Tax=Phenylobacterium sp. J426 TaxID=2898439 RepID=UPI0021517840|nr:hypothetical protein [Phenylobacterium sp. J426]MCR5876719.1 hypothetical protein [Phenylobacterium sp. J426]